MGLIKKPSAPSSRGGVNRYAVVISARNEAEVIKNLLRTIRTQTYPKELIDTYVVADNCTDNTAVVAKNEGAFVFERFNTEKVGKGYALDWLFGEIKKVYPDKNYAGFFVFDADNIIEPNFIEAMDKTFSDGYRVVTSYRNSKNYGENWITAGYSLWFLREAKFLNFPRMSLGTSCAISGTGFLISADLLEENGGWIHHLLTEDIEFTTDCISKGEKIGYCGDAVLYDEQPTSFHQSYIQRLRWSKGFYQVFSKYAKKLFRGILKGNFSCYDMLMTLMPAMLLTLISLALNTVAIPVGFIVDSEYMPMVLKTLGQTFLSFYGIFYFLGAITTISERKNIYCSKAKKVLYTFTFPLFMMTYIPISIIALFKKVKWEPIKHSVSITISDVCNNKQDNTNNLNA